MLKKLILALLLGSLLTQPVMAASKKVHIQSEIQEKDKPQKTAEAFIFGLVTGLVPVIGQMFGVSVLIANLTDWNGKADYQFAASFAAGHVTGTAVWAYPWYLVYRNHLESKSNRGYYV